MGIGVSYGKVLGVNAYFFRVGNWVVAIEPTLLTEEMKKKSVVRFPLEAQFRRQRDVYFLEATSAPSAEVFLYLVEGVANKFLPQILSASGLPATVYDYLTYQDHGSYNCWFVEVPKQIAERFVSVMKGSGFEIL